MIACWGKKDKSVRVVLSIVIFKFVQVGPQRTRKGPADWSR